VVPEKGPVNGCGGGGKLEIKGNTSKTLQSRQDIYKQRHCTGSYLHDCCQLGFLKITSFKTFYMANNKHSGYHQTMEHFTTECSQKTSVNLRKR